MEKNYIIKRGENLDTKLKILKEIVKSEKPLRELSNSLGLKYRTLSKHLRFFEKKGIIQYESKKINGRKRKIPKIDLFNDTIGNLGEYLEKYLKREKTRRKVISFIRELPKDYGNVLAWIFIHDNLVNEEKKLVQNEGGRILDVLSANIISLSQLCCLYNYSNNDKNFFAPFFKFNSEEEYKDFLRRQIKNVCEGLSRLFLAFEEKKRSSEDRKAYKILFLQFARLARQYDIIKEVITTENL